MSNDGDDYKDILNEGVDRLNEGESFQHTGFSKEKKQVVSRPIFTSYWFTGLVILLIANIGLRLYFKSDTPGVLKPEQANREIAEKYSSSPESYQTAKKLTAVATSVNAQSLEVTNKVSAVESLLEKQGFTAPSLSSSVESNRERSFTWVGTIEPLTATPTANKSN